MTKSATDSLEEDEAPKHSRLVPQDPTSSKSQQEEPYDIPAEDRSIYNEEDKIEEMVEAEKEAKRKAQIQA